MLLQSLGLSFRPIHCHRSTPLIPSHDKLAIPKMYLLTYLGTGMTLLSLSNALPTVRPGKEHCHALIETSPWQVSSIVVYNAMPAAAFGSFICFRVRDTNPGLDFDTTCSINMPAGTGLKPDDSPGWHVCDDERVGFLYQSGNLQLRRSYVDDW
jgi:hypothetical protein